MVRTYIDRMAQVVFGFQRTVLLNLAVVLMFAAMIVMFYEASSRTLVSRSHWWAEEAVRFLVIWSVLLSIAIASRNGHFIRMDLLLLVLPRRLVLASAVVTSLCGLVFSGFLAFAALEHVLHLERIGMLTQSTLNLPLWQVRLVLPLGSALYFVYFLICLLEALSGRDPYRPIEDLD